MAIKNKLKESLSNFFLKILEVIFTIIIEIIYRIILIPNIFRKLATLTIGKREKRHWCESIYIFFLFLGILILVNFIASRRSYHFRCDFTKAKYLSLSLQTKKILKDLDKKIKIIGFFQKTDPRKEIALSILNEYAYLSPYIEIKFIDPDINFQEAINYDIKEYGTIIFQAGNKKTKITSWGEQEITSSIRKVTKPLQTKKIYFLVGHQEPRIDDISGFGYNMAKQALLQEQYQVEELNLFKEKNIPYDCAVLVIVNPQTNIPEEEIEVLEQYFKNGGKSFILIDTNTSSSINKFLEKKNIKIGEEIVIIDPQECFWGINTTLTIKEYNFHQITKDIKEIQDPYLILPGVKSVTPQHFPDRNITYEILFESSFHSWGETDPKIAKFDFNQDKRGPLPLACIVEKEIEKEKKMRIIVIGDSHFANNNFFRAFRNQDIFMNSINWLTEEEELISIRPKSIDIPKIGLTKTQRNFIFITTVIFFPFLVLFLGSIVWFKRRS